MTEIDDKIKALALELGCSTGDITEEGGTLYAEGNEYSVLTDEEADEACREYIEESLWAFNASFLAGMTRLPEEMFKAIQDKCEGANDPIYRVVDSTCGIKNFVNEATSADGRGHFLNHYDGEEIELQGGFYAYRTN